MGSEGFEPPSTALEAAILAAEKVIFSVLAIELRTHIHYIGNLINLRLTQYEYFVSAY